MSHTLEVVRFTVAPGDRAALLADRAAAIAALGAAFSGLEGATLAELEDGTWIDVLRWASDAQAKAAASGMPSVPEAARWAAHIADVRELSHGTIRG